MSKCDELDNEFELIGKLFDDLRSVWMSKQSDVAGAAGKIKDIEQTPRGVGQVVSEIPNIRMQLIGMQTNINDVEEKLFRTGSWSGKTADHDLKIKQMDAGVGLPFDGESQGAVFEER